MNGNDSSSNFKVCGCKGIRRCLICEQQRGDLATKSPEEPEPPLRFEYCEKCLRLHPVESAGVCDGPSLQCVSGIFVLREIISVEEEHELIQQVDRTPWSPSQSGRRKQDYGPQVNFKKEKISIKNFTGFPSWSKVLIERLRKLKIHRDTAVISRYGKHDVRDLDNFLAVELCALEYVPERGSCIVPHFDDRWVWGDRLITVNLLSETVLTLHRRLDLTSDPISGECDEFALALREFLSSSNSRVTSPLDVQVDIKLPPRSLNVLYDDARYKWLHSIKRENIRERRVALTFRELTDEFLPAEAQASSTEPVSASERRKQVNRETGRQLLELATHFDGVSLFETLQSRTTNNKAEQHGEDQY